MFHHNLRKQYINKNFGAFWAILSELHSSADDNNDELPKHLEDALKSFIEKTHEHSFVQWFRLKERCYAKTDLKIEALLLTPFFYSCSKLIYSFSEGNKYDIFR